MSDVEQAPTKRRGRPPKPGSAKKNKHYIGINLDKKVHTALLRFSNSQDRGVSNAATILIKEGLAKRNISFNEV